MRRKEGSRSPKTLQGGGRTPWRWVFFALAFVLRFEGACLSQSEQTLTEKWSRFPAFLWMHKGPPIDAKLAETLREYGIDGINLEAHQGQVDIETIGLSYYLGHAAGKGDLFLREDVYANAIESGGDHPKRPNSFLDPSVRERLVRNIKRSAESYRGSGLMGISIEDEMSTTRFTRPADFCFSSEAMTLFRRWLEERYGSLDALCDHWGMSFDSWDDVMPKTTSYLIREGEKTPINQLRVSSWADHREFMDLLFYWTIRGLLEWTEELWPSVPSGFLGGQPPSAFGGYDWGHLASLPTFLEVYDVQSSYELVRSLSRTNCRHVETMHLQGKSSKALSLGLARRVARGDAGVILWSSEAAFDGPIRKNASRRLVDTGEALRRVRTDARGISEMAREREDVGIVYSHSSVRGSWLLDAAGDADTWRKRLPSYEATHSRSLLTRRGWTRFLEDVGASYRFIDSRAMKALSEREWPRVLILADAVALSSDETLALESFVDRGGTLFIDARFGLFDETLVSASRPSFLDVLPHPSTEQTASSLLKVSEGVDEVFGLPKDTLATCWDDVVFPEGLVYWPMDLSLYEARRLSDGSRALRAHLLRSLERAGAKPYPVLEFDGDSLNAGVKLYRYRDGNDKWIALVAESLVPGSDELEIRLNFGSEVGLDEFRSGRLIKRVESKIHPLVMDSDSMTLLRLRSQ